MNISIDHKDDLNAVITVNVDKNDYAPRVEKALKNYQKRANIPGFRPGKAPMGMIQKMYGSAVLVDEVNNFTSDALNNYLKENALEVLGQPVLSTDNENYDWTTTEDFEFRFDIGLSPKFDLNISKNDYFVKHVPAIDEDLVSKEVERSRQRYGNQVSAEIAEANDMLTIEAKELTDEKTVLEGGVQAEFPILLSAIKHEATQKAFIGQKTGATVTADIFEVFDHNGTEISTVLKINKETVNDLHKTFSFEVKEIKRQESAVMNQEFFDKVYGENAVKTEEEFRAKVKEELKQFYASEADHALEHELFDALLAKHSISLPDSFLKRWLMDRHPDKFTSDNVDSKYEPEAKYLRSTLFQEKVIANQELKIEDQDLLNASVNYTKRMFFGYNMNIPVSDYLETYAKEQLKDQNYRSRMLNMAIETKVINALKNMVTIEEKELPIDDFFKKMKEHSDRHHQQHEHAHEHEHEHEHSHEGAHSH